MRLGPRLNAMAAYHCAPTTGRLARPAARRPVRIHIYVNSGLRPLILETPHQPGLAIKVLPNAPELSQRLHTWLGHLAAHHRGRILQVWAVQRQIISPRRQAAEQCHILAH